MLQLDKLTISIGTLAKILNIHQRTLRIYDKEGILVPKRTTKNRRMYSFDDIEKAKIILFLTRNLALNISGVKIVLYMLEENKTDRNEQYKYLEKIAKKLNISMEIQNENVNKASRRGRRNFKNTED